MQCLFLHSLQTDAARRCADFALSDHGVRGWVRAVGVAA